MFKPDFTASNNDFKQLPVGGYVCEIKGIREERSKRGNDMLVVMLDIAEGPYKDYFIEKYKKMQSESAGHRKWPNGGTKYLVLNPRFRTAIEQYQKFIECVEQSNNFKVDWTQNYSQMRSKLVGANFGREEFMGSEGPAFATKIFWFNTVDEVRNGTVKPPNDKLLNTKTIATEESDEGLPF